MSLAALALTASPAAAYRVPSSTMFSIAGEGTPCSAAGSCGDGGIATAARLSFPEGVAVDRAGNVYVADWGDSEVRQISPAGRVTTLAGNGAACANPSRCGDGGAARDAELNLPEAVAVDRAGNVYIADSGDNEIRKVSRGGDITTIAGDGTPCATAPACGDGGAATGAQLNAPGAVALDSAGDVLIADTGDNEIRKVSRSGKITTVAGDGSLCSGAPSCGDGGVATAAQLSYPDGLAVGPAGALFIADTGDNEVRKVFSAGTISRVAGDGAACQAAPSCGDGALATTAQLTFPEGLAVDHKGEVLIADWGDSEIRKVSRAGTITRMAGNGIPCAVPPSCGDGRGALLASLASPEALALDRAGDLYVADVYDNELRWIPGRHARPGALTGPAGTPVAVVAFDSVVSKSAVTTRFALSAPAAISLSVARSGSRKTRVGHTHGRAGLGEIIWNRSLGGKTVPHGRYTLTITATIGSHKASSSLRVGL